MNRPHFKKRKKNTQNLTFRSEINIKHKSDTAKSYIVFLKYFIISTFIDNLKIQIYSQHTHTHTHTHIYIYIYIYI